VGADIQNGASVLGEHVLFATFEDVLYALKRGNGHMAWRAPLPSRPASGPILVGDSVLVACYETEILGFEGRTGKRLGGLKTPAEIRTAPLLVGDRLYIGLRDRSIVAYTLDMTIARPLPTPPPAPKRDAKKRNQPGVP
jgi:outer membrane protein assembly factor BamB